MGIGSYNRVGIVNKNGETVSMTISRAINVGGMTKDICGGNLFPVANNKPEYFYIIPITKGAIKVQLLSGEEDYLISEAEVESNLGTPIPYLVKKVFSEGTTAEFNIGW